MPQFVHFIDIICMFIYWQLLLLLLLCLIQSSVDLKLSFSCSHISILLYDCIFGIIVVLEVILDNLATLKITELN